MICKSLIRPPIFYKKIKNLKGFINNKTIQKYINKNQKITKKKYMCNPNNLLIFITLFCGTLFFYHMYTLWKRYKSEHNIKGETNIGTNIGTNIEEKTKNKINIVPLSGIY